MRCGNRRWSKFENVQELLNSLFGIEPPGPGQDTAWELNFPRAWPSWTLLAILVVAALYFFALYRREGTSTTPRIKLLLTVARWSLVALLLVMLAEVDLRIDRRGLPYLAVVVDDSASMSIADHYDDSKADSAAQALTQAAGLTSSSRLDLAKAVLLSRQGETLRKLAAEHRIRLYAASSSMRLIGEYSGVNELDQARRQILELSAERAESRLGQGLRDVLNDLSGVPPTAVIYLTDGITTDGDSLADAAIYSARKQVPVHAIGLGDPRPVRDLELRDLLVDDVVFVDDVVNFEAKLSARGIDGGRATVRLREKERDVVLATQQVDIPMDGQPATVRLQHRAREVGDVTYVMEVDPVDREFQTRNNALERQVSVREEKLRVLFVESYPRFEYRFIKHLLERDPSIDLHVLLLEADVEYAEMDRTAITHFPTSQEELRTFDVILFGDVNPFYLNENQMRHLNEFVLDKGGGLALLAGPRYMPIAYRDTPLETVIPIDFSGAQAGAPSQEPFRPVLTVEGRANPIFRLGQDDAESQTIWENLPGHYWLFEAPLRKPGALPLAVHPTRTGDQGPLPAILVQQVGAGKALMLNFDSTWRWRQRVGDLYFSRFWVQTIRYLSRSRLVGQTRQAELTADRREYQRGQPVELRVRLLDESLTAEAGDSITVLVERDGGDEKRVALRKAVGGTGLYEGILSGAGEGKFRAWMVTPSVKGAPPSAAFEVVAPPGEFRRVEMDEPALRQVAERTGGKYYTFLTADDLASQIPAGRKIPLDTDPPIPLWNSWTILSLFMAVIMFEWVLRKQRRML
jgi:hypothetical protein